MPKRLISYACPHHCMYIYISALIADCERGHIPPLLISDPLTFTYRCGPMPPLRFFTRLAQPSEV